MADNIYIEYNTLSNYEKQIDATKMCVEDILSEFDNISNTLDKYEAYKGAGISALVEYSINMNEKLTQLYNYLDLCLRYIRICIMSSINENDELSKEWMTQNGNS